MNPLPSMKSMMNRPGEEYVNDPEVEGLWAMKAVEHMEIYFNLISAISPRVLRLTPKDDWIYAEFRKEFPLFDVNLIDLHDLKSDQAKSKWRPFCNMFDGLVEDFNFATMIRLDSSLDYSQHNSIVVPRIQFLAIEIARNREGFNDGIRDKYPPIKKSRENGDENRIQSEEESGTNEDKSGTNEEESVTNEEESGTNEEESETSHQNSNEETTKSWHLLSIDSYLIISYKLK